MFAKCVTIAICAANFHFLCTKLFNAKYWFPFQVLQSMLIFKPNTSFAIVNSSIFHSVVYCKVSLSHISSDNIFTSQCVLTGNTLYEKIFSLIWLLIIISIFVTIVDIFKWCTFFICKQRILYKYINNRSVQFSKMINGDLYFLILMISVNVNDILACEIVEEMNRQINMSNNDDIVLDDVQIC